MKCIQKITLSLLTVAAVSTFNSSYAAPVGILEVNFTDGAEMAGAVAGNVKFVGTGSCTFSGSATGDVELNQGTVKVSDASPFGAGAIYMTGGNLEAVVDFTLPTLHVNVAGTLTSLAGGDDSSSTMDINIVDGIGALTLAGAGDVKISGSMRNNTGGVSSSEPLQAISLVSGSRLPNADNSFVGDLNLLSAPGGANSYDSASRILSAQTINVASNFGGSPTATVASSYFVGTLKARKINITTHGWAVPVTAQ